MIQLLRLLSSIVVEDFISFYFNDLCCEAWIFPDLMPYDGPKGITVLCEVGISCVLPLSVKNLTRR